MNKNSLSVVACVLSVAAMALSVAGMVNTPKAPKDAPEVPSVSKQEFEEAQKQVDARILAHAKDLSDTRSRFMSRDVDMVKRIGVLESKAGIAPASN